MQHTTWTDEEKKIARCVAHAALQRELAEVMAEFKSRAADAEHADDMWSVLEYLARARQRIDTKYDFRYSKLPIVLGTLLCEKRIEADDLTGLSDAKRRCVRAVAALGARGNAG